MRDIGPTFLACVSSLVLVVLGDPSSFSDRPKSTTLPFFEGSKSFTTRLFSSATPTNTITASILSSSPSASASPPEVSTTVLIDVSSFITSANNFNPSTIRAVTTSDSLLEVSKLPMSSSSATPGGDKSSSHNTLVIALAAVLGAVGLLLIGTVIFLLYRYRRGQLPFAHRGASPINDDEIASWRRTGKEQKLTIPSPTYRPAIREVADLHLKSPGWTWTASPSSIRTVSAHITDHQVQAQAPNARAGLTDEVVPGAEAFIPQPKRQSSRLAKRPPGHSRTKSRRSSMSGRSLWSPDRTSNDYIFREQASWYAVDGAAPSSHFKTEQSSDTPGTSTFGEHVSGGLSPRPERRAKPWEQEVSREDIGRAIA
ncbi:hypothetical protein VTL71DRAFT_1620 [Oculimacula yallundae]|uniref:Uncharacterized protein n=1 Tax=Oculimacula yallundae TaxID=86028 RepID=A0ABR4CB87_9HELO